MSGKKRFMKKLCICFALSFVLLFSCAALACNKDKGNPTTPPDGEVPSLKITSNISMLEQGDETTFTAVLSGAEGTVKFSSSDNEVLQVSENGAAVAKKAGTATVKAESGEYSDSVSVTVRDTLRPVLVLGHTTANIYVGGTFSTSTLIKYNGSDVTSGYNVTWSVEKPDVLELGDDGTVTGKKSGESKITATTTYRFFSLTESCTVTVLGRDELSLNVNTLGLSTLAYDGKEESATLIPTVYVDGVKVDNPSVSYTVSGDNPSCISVSADGAVAAVSEGSATITATYTGEGKDKIGTVKCDVTVTRPTIETELHIEEYLIGGDIALPALGSSFSQAAKDDFIAANITDIKDGANSVTAESDPKKIDKQKCIGSPTEKELTIVTDKANYTIGVTVVNYKITGKEDLVSADIEASLYKQKNGTITTGQAPNQQTHDAFFFDGYVIIEDDIDFNGESFVGIATASAGSCGAYATSPILYGFRGVIDGKNHTISNMNFTTVNSAFVGILGTNGVIKNISFINSNVSGTNSNAVIASKFGNATLENIYVDGSITAGSTGNSYSSNGVAIGRFEGASNSKIKNCVINVRGSLDGLAKTAVFGYMMNFRTQNIFENCVVIGSSSLCGFYDTDIANDFIVFDLSVDSRAGVTYCENIAAFESQASSLGYAKDTAHSSDSDCFSSGKAIYTASGKVDVVITIPTTDHNYVGDECTICHSKKITAEIDCSEDGKKGTYALEIGTGETIVSVKSGGEDVSEDTFNKATKTFTFDYTEASDQTKVFDIMCETNDGKTKLYSLNLTVWSLFIKDVTDLQSANDYMIYLRNTTGNSVRVTQCAAYYKLIEDIDMQGETWDYNTHKIGYNVKSGTKFTVNGVEFTATDIPMAYTDGISCGFMGVFDGNSKSIKNWNVNTTPSGSNNNPTSALFYVIANGAVIKNLSFVDCETNKGSLLAEVTNGGEFTNIKFIRLNVSSNAYADSVGSSPLLGFIGGRGLNTGVVNANADNDSRIKITVKDVEIENVGNRATTSYFAAIGIVTCSADKPLQKDNVTLENITVNGFNRLMRLSEGKSTDNANMAVNSIEIETVDTLTNYVTLVGSGVTIVTE